MITHQGLRTDSMYYSFWAILKSLTHFFKSWQVEMAQKMKCCLLTLIESDDVNIDAQPLLKNYVIK